MEGATGDHQQNNGIASKPPSASPDSGVAGIKENGTQNHVSSPNHLKVNHSSKSSSSGDKHNSSLHKSSSDKHHRSSSSDPSKHKSSSSHGDKHRSSSSHGDKHKSSSSSSSKHHSSSHSSSKDSSKSKHSSSSSKDSSKHKHRDGHSSSSSSKHKDGHSSSSSKERSKDGHHSSSKHKDGSSSSKHRDGEHKSKEHRHSSDKHKDKHREKNRESSSSKPKEEGKPSSEVKVKTAEHSSKSPEPKVKSPDRGMKSPERSVKSPDIKIKEEPMSPSKVKHEVKQEKTPEVTVKQEVKDDSEDDMPLSARMPQPAKVKAEKRRADSDDDDEPLSARLDKAKKQKKVKTEKETVKRKMSEPDSPQKKKKKKKDEAGVKSPKKKAKEEQEEKKWKWWEESKKDDGVKWNYLEHKGPVFAPAYEPLPDDVRFYYNGKEMKLSEDAEEVAGFYSRMLEHDYTTKDIFNNNFFKDWRKVMTSKEREVITDLKKCNFKELFEFYKQQSEDRKNRTKEQKQALKKENEAIVEEYGFCVIDGHRQKIGNFKIEPPGLFRGRGEHPKQGMLKTRTQPEDVIINCSKDAPVPKAPEGHKWKEVRHDNTVTWLASWCENIQGSNKYVMLNAASKLKGEKDWQKYEMARKLHKCVDKIRATYHEDWKSKEMRVRQRAVALYFIDKLALRAGNEKEEGETADTVGCCSLRVEHLRLHEKMDDLDWVVEFDFLGKDSIRYYNKVAIEKRVFKNLQLFMENKNEGDDLFDRLNTTILNKHLQILMEGLTAKVFRTYNASKTLQDQLELLTNEDDNVPAKLLSYNRANRAVAVLCNHQRAVPKNFDKQMENLQNKIDDKKAQLKEAKKSVKEAKADLKAVNTDKNRNAYEKKRKAVERIQLQLNKLEVQATDKDENKEIALGTSKLNYLDPRISVAWCKKYEVPIEKIYNKTQREKFAWAIDMADEDYEF